MGGGGGGGCVCVVFVSGSACVVMCWYLQGYFPLCSVFRTFRVGCMNKKKQKQKRGLTLRRGAPCRLFGS